MSCSNEPALYDTSIPTFQFYTILNPGLFDAQDIIFRNKTVQACTIK